MFQFPETLSLAFGAVAKSFQATEMSAWMLMQGREQLQRLMTVKRREERFVESLPTEQVAPDAVVRCFNNAIIGKANQEHFEGYQVFPLVFSDEVIGCLEVTPGDAVSCDAVHCMDVASLLAIQIGREYVEACRTSLDEWMTSEIDLGSPRQVFIQLVIERIQEATGFPFVHLYEITSNNMITLSARSQEDAQSWALDQFKRSSRSRLSKSIFDVIDTDLEARVAFTSTLKRSGRSLIKEPVQSLIFPIGGTRGEVNSVVVFSAHSQRMMTKSEIESCWVATRLLDMAMTMHSHSNVMREETYTAATSIGMTSIVDILQSGRHEVKAHLEALEHNLGNLSDRFGEQPFEVNDEDRELVEDLRLASDEIRRAMRQMTESVESLSSVSEIVNLRSTWEKVGQLLRPSLDAAGVELRLQGRRAMIDGYERLLQQAFINLVTNSIEAFRSRNIEGKRWISVDLSKSKKKVILEYTDNAGGISITGLRNRETKKKASSIDEVFKQGVSSKSAGTGFGMHLVKRYIQKVHRGQVEIVNPICKHKKSSDVGVSIRIELPKDRKL